jgi:hypothetical protein
MREHRFLGSSKCLYISRVRERQSSHALEEELGGTWDSERMTTPRQPLERCPSCHPHTVVDLGPAVLCQRHMRAAWERARRMTVQALTGSTYSPHGRCRARRPIKSDRRRHNP